MRGKRFKSASKKLWGYAKWFLGWPLAIFGLTGVTDNLDTWSKWIDKALSWAHSAMTDPRVQQLATVAVEIADFVNRTPVRIALVIVGISILIWGWRPFWSLRHRAFSLWRGFLGEQVWLDRESALKIIRSSDWARLKAPGDTIAGLLARSLAGGLGGGATVFDRDQIQFKAYLDLTLDSFEQNNPSYVRETEGKKEYREDRLLLFVRKAMESEVQQKFGPIPTNSV